MSSGCTQQLSNGAETTRSAAERVRGVLLMMQEAGFVCAAPGPSRSPGFVLYRQEWLGWRETGPQARPAGMWWSSPISPVAALTWPPSKKITDVD